MYMYMYLGHELKERILVVVSESAQINNFSSLHDMSLLNVMQISNEFKVPENLISLEC